MSGYLSEIFASFEGEGDRAGMPSVFVRLSGCNLICSYCDTVYARERSDSATLYLGKLESRINNPIGAGRLAELVAASFPEYRDVRVTGGEPLLQADFVGEAAGLLRNMGMGLHLETNGILVEEVARVGHLFDSITMDFKLPSTQEGEDLAMQHVAFIAALAERRIRARLSIKIVVTPECADEEVHGAFALIAQADRRAPVFLQPEFGETGPVVSGERMLHLMATGLKMLPDVRVSVQIHKILKMR